MIPKPLISIITPTLNMGRFLEECIESVLNQNYPHIEHIIQDGGSIDNTLDILKKYSSKKYKGKIRIFVEPDTGQNDGLNKALQKVKGDIILVLNADDTIFSYACSWAIEQFKLFPSMAVIYGDQYFVNEKGSVVGHTIGTKYNFEKLFCLELIPPAQASFINRKLFETVGLYADTTIETCPDFEMWVRIGLKYPMRYVPGTITKYRTYPHNDSRGPRSTKKFYLAKKTIIDRILNDKKTTKNIKGLGRRAYSGLAFWAANEAREPGSIMLGLQFLITSFVHNPTVSRFRQIINIFFDRSSVYGLRNLPFWELYDVCLFTAKKKVAQKIPKRFRFFWRNLSAHQRAVAFSNVVVQLDSYKKLAFHPKAGKIENGIQYFFDGSKTIYPHVSDEFMHQVFTLTKGAPEPDEIILFLKILKKIPQKSVMFELGAGQGFYSILAGTRLPQICLFLIEANPHFFQIIKANMNLNELSSRSHILHKAIDRIDDKMVYLEEDGYGSSIHTYGDYTVQTITVDSIAKAYKLSHIDIIHMDIQGAEYNALNGMKELLSQKRVSYIFIATHKSQLHSLCLGYLQTFHYQILYSRDPNNSSSFDGILIGAMPGNTFNLTV